MILLFRGVLVDERVVDRKVPNDADLRNVLTLIIRENLVLVVVLVLESKAL